jgi:hypothetical protein
MSHALSLLIQLCFRQSSGNGYQWQAFPFLWVSDLYRSLIHRNSLGTPTQLLLSQGDTHQNEFLYGIHEGGLFTNWTHILGKSQDEHEYFSVSEMTINNYYAMRTAIMLPSFLFLFLLPSFLFGPLLLKLASEIMNLLDIWCCLLDGRLACR